MRDFFLFLLFTSCRTIALFGFMLPFFGIVVQAQEHHSHAHSRNEIGISPAIAYEIEHKEWLPLIHVHYFRSLSVHSRWAIGGGIEYLPGQELHFEVAAGVRFQPIERIQLSVMPGISITHKIAFSVHTELSYEALQLGSFHLGPVVGYAWTKGHSHFSAGIHLAYSFD